MFEVVKDGKRVESQNYPLPPDGPVYLFLVRRHGRVLWAASPDISTLPTVFRGTELALPSTIKIGLSASNISATPFTATFENFALLNDVAIIGKW